MRMFKQSNSAVFCLVFVYVFCLLNTFFSVSFAQDANIEEFTISTASDPEFSFSAGYDGNSFLVTWNCAACEGSGNVHARLVSSSGELLGNEIRTGKSKNNFILVKFDGANYLMVWVEEGQVYGQFVTPQGLTIGAQFPVFSISAQDMAGIEFGKNTYLIVTSNGSDVYGGLVSKSGPGVTGIPLGEKIAISNASGSQRLPVVAFDGTNYLAIWIDGRRGTPEKDIYGRFVSETGALVGSDFIISENDGEVNFWPNVLFDGTNYLVAWSERVNNQWDVNGRFISKDGNPVSDKFAIANSTKDEMHPRIAFDGENYLVGWIENFETDRSTIKARFITKSRELTDPIVLFEKNSKGIPAFESNIIFDGRRYFLSVTRCQSFLENPQGGPKLPVKGDIYGEFVELAKPIPSKPTYVDTTAPITTASAVDENGADYLLGSWRRSSYIDVTLTCDDNNESGCNVTQYCVDQSNTCTPLRAYSAPVRISTEGISYIRYLSKDNVGNFEKAQSSTIKIDNTPPTVTINSPKPNSQLSDRKVTIQFSVTETNLNYVNVSMLQDNKLITSTKSRATGTSTVALDAPSDGTYDITVTAVDNASNKQTVKVAGITVTSTSSSEPSATCKKEGEGCTNYTDCCSNSCAAGVCAPAPAEKKDDLSIILVAAGALVVVLIIAFFFLKRPKKPAAAQAKLAAPQLPSVPQSKAELYGLPAPPGRF